MDRLRSTADSLPSRSGPRGLLPIWLLLWALVLAPVLGQMHAVLHAEGMPAASRVSVHTADTPLAESLQDLFAGHDKAGDCRLYDQASHGDQHAGHALLVLPAALPAPLVAFSLLHVAQRALAPACARGPPAFR